MVSDAIGPTPVHRVLNIAFIFELSLSFYEEWVIAQAVEHSAVKVWNLLHGGSILHGGCICSLG